MSKATQSPYTTGRGRISRSTVWLVLATAILVVGLTATIF